MQAWAGKKVSSMLAHWKISEEGRRMVSPSHYHCQRVVKKMEDKGEGSRPKAPLQERSHGMPQRKGHSPGHVPLKLEPEGVWGLPWYPQLPAEPQLWIIIGKPQTYLRKLARRHLRLSSVAGISGLVVLPKAPLISPAASPWSPGKGMPHPRTMTKHQNLTHPTSVVITPGLTLLLPESCTGNQRPYCSFTDAWDYTRAHWAPDSFI